MASNNAGSNVSSLLPINSNSNYGSSTNNKLTEQSLEKKSNFLSGPKTAYGNEQFQNYNPNLQFAYMTYNQAFINLKQQHKVKSQHQSKLHSLSQYQKSSLIKQQQQGAQHLLQPSLNNNASITHKDAKCPEGPKCKKLEANQPKSLTNKYNNFKRIILNSKELGNANANAPYPHNHAVNKSAINYHKTQHNFNPSYDISKNVNTESSIYNINEFQVNSTKKENPRFSSSNSHSNNNNNNNSFTQDAKSSINSGAMIAKGKPAATNKPAKNTLRNSEADHRAGNSLNTSQEAVHLKGSERQSDGSHRAEAGSAANHG